MPVTPGTQLGPYLVIEPLGSGGMGDVFKARDTRLDRAVAIKTLKADAASDPDRRARFEREARAISAAAHPHICTLYDVGSTPGDEGSTEFLVMEALEGETLADRLARGPLPVAEAIVIAIQIADALDHAHRRGIVHRDLKPSNVMLTRTGAKLLDFGLAALRDRAAPIIEAATRTTALTGVGSVLGTLQYIAPEQLEGREVDAGADVFSFGAVLYEMVTGRRAFEGTSAAATISAILQSQPTPIRTLQSQVPAPLARLVDGCLAKNPEERWASAHDLKLMLQAIRDEPENGAGAPAGRARAIAWLGWAAAALAIVLAAALAIRHPSTAGETLNVLSILPADGTAFTAGEAPVISPDGRRVAFVANDTAGRTLLYVRDIGSFEAQPIPGSEDVMLPFWSPDGRSLGFFADGLLKVTAVSGGTPVTLAPAPVPRGGTWSPDGVILFSPYPKEPLQIVPAGGGPVRVAPRNASEVSTRWSPSFLPDGRHYIFLATGRTNLGAMLRIGTIDGPDAADLVPSRSSGVYAPSGHLLFRREQSLVAQPFDPKTLQLSGTPATVLQRVAYNPITYQSLFSVSSNGSIAAVDTLAPGRLVWVDRAGRREDLPVTPTGVNTLCLSADGTRVVYDAADPATGGVDIWALDPPSGTPQRLTFDPTVDFYPACAPTGTGIVFASLRLGEPTLFRGDSARPNSERLLIKTTGPSISTDWAQDGQIVYEMYSPKTSWDIWVVPAAAGEVQPFSVTEAEERNARVSPNGRWIAYNSNRSGPFDVYVQPFPATGATWQVTHGGGRQPLWSPDGRQLFYLAPDKRIMAVDVKTEGASFAQSAPRLAADVRVSGWERTTQGAPYAISPDGQRFLVSTAGDAPVPITLLSNWTQLLK
jgi:eukaryotic-like serine/threonine-protein kinase